MFGGYQIILSNNKNVAYRLYFPLFNNGSSAGVSLTGATWSGGGGATILQISKDGGAPATLSNVPVQIGNGWYYIDLTQTEMNADLVLLSIHNSASAGAMCNISIQTNVTFNTTGSVSASDVWAYATRTLTSGGAGSGISMDDVIENKATLPTGPLTVRQVFELIAKRLERNKNTPRL